MPALAAITLKNAANADVVFTPASLDSNGVATLRSAEAVFQQRSTLTASVASPKSGSTVVRAKFRAVVPTMDSVDPTKKIAETLVSIDVVLPLNATITQRKDAKAYAIGLLNSAVGMAAFEQFEAPY